MSTLAATQVTTGHGTECPITTDPDPRGRSECQCVACHCGDDYRPGWLGACARCHRPLIINGRVHR